MTTSPGQPILAEFNNISKNPNSLSYPTYDEQGRMTRNLWIWWDQNGDERAVARHFDPETKVRIKETWFKNHKVHSEEVPAIIHFNKETGAPAFAEWRYNGCESDSARGGPGLERYDSGSWSVEPPAHVLS